VNQIIFINQTNQKLTSLKRLYTSILNRAQTHLKLSSAISVEVVIVTNQTMQSYNFKFRNIDKVTDVLSFPLQDQQSEKESLLGVVMIAYDKAVEQSKTYGHGLKRELSFLFIHGILHLLGYDHHTPKEEKEMIALQDAIIGKRQ
jgi:probable rRNA maturation factor